MARATFLAVAMLALACSSTSGKHGVANVITTACTATPPTTSVSMLIGLDAPHPQEQLASPWHPTALWYLGDDYAIVFARAGAEEAFVIVQINENGSHIRGAVSVGTPCRDLDFNLIGHCVVGDVEDPWVFAETDVALLMCGDGMPVIRAWRGHPDGTITSVPAKGITCGRRCDW